jgi:hypothetical protein
VHLTRGQHLVKFSYRPRALYAGAAISGVTALALLLWTAVDHRLRRARTGSA